ncbi:MAG: hypothetical protein HYZ53_23370 [Planctomycetes bacterium]|nr:hypothetical protein [Planctomycetota bacterium]
MIDLHAHVLPGVDDGPKEPADALAMARKAWADGIRTQFATPHTLNGAYTTPRSLVLRKVAELREALREEGIGLELVPGGEVHVHESILDLLASGELPTLADRGRHLLLEFPFERVPGVVPDLLFRLRLKGVTPVIAHPERNDELQSSPKGVESLLRQGAWMQVTGGSFTGDFGTAARDLAFLLLDLDQVHLIGSDAHGVSWRPPLLAAVRDVIVRRAGAERARRLFEENPRRILEARPRGAGGGGMPAAPAR